MKIKLTIMAASLLSIVAAPSFASVGDTATYKFDLPATSSFSSGYPIVAELKITETASGVVTFELTPNWASPGFSHNDSTVNRLDFVYQGPALTAANFSQPAVHGADIDKFSYKTNPNMDSSYKSDDQHIVIDWFAHNKSNRFDDTPYTNSIWTISGTGVDITDFTGTRATTTSGKPDPIFGIISVDPYSLKDLHPTPSNWVSAVPEPETYAMLLAGLGLLGFMARRRKESAV
ncbi:MAG: FxDxF family PEP-CTERM protein [Nitrosomonas sp.]|uniref:FxDxF family PEP-CTERM protein n=1 Tax=Nitrosomonas sp. TaxID=42353 RepID=UPI0025D89435|nr:FxDxF family PEP-CTERM protein [Nitrosomonas sp.]MCG7757694.1 FxDxF family PEP-CTERM protein [Nitrosomonas sp.]UJP00585.1 MAG: FxDxF family PEP-CTERM protein [Nitrosomonas sp.]UJP03335.1 MAG: FxDxF family PEP-CTERM protein [Nitrosomonas sp.]